MSAAVELASRFVAMAEDAAAAMRALRRERVS
jgi:hypothetical protein